MANVYFNDIAGDEDGDLDNANNWWSDDSWTTPLGRVPEAGDVATFNKGTSINTGTLTATTAVVSADGEFNNLFILGGVFNCNVVGNFMSGTFIHGGTFNGTVTSNNDIVVSTDFAGGATFNGNVSGLMSDGFMYAEATFNGVVINPVANHISPTFFPISTMIFNHRLEMTGSPTRNLFSANSPDVADPADVRDGVTNLGVEGTLEVAEPDYPTEANVKIGVVYADEAMTGTYDGSDRWTDPGEENVEEGVEYKANSTSNNKTGTLEVGGGGDSPGPVAPVFGLVFPTTH